MNDNAVSVSRVSKNFHYTSARASTLKSLVTGIFRSDSSKSSDIQHALRDVSFDVKKGEFFGIVGRNGSGKSTLLKMIAGIYQPNSGHIRVEGKLVPFIELGVGFNPELTGRENVYLNGALLGFSRPEIEAQYQEIVEFAELDKFMDQQLKNYSSGMQVRLAFSMAVRAKADVLLIDEVLAVGDADFQRKCYEYFKRLKKDKKTVVFVSHDMSAVQEYCDRVALIEKSKLVTVDSAEKVAQLYRQLFNSEELTKEIIEGKRWGDESVITTEIKTEVTAKEIIIRQTVQAQADGLDTIIGIRIKDSSGKEVAGTNTKIEQVRVTPTIKGTTHTVTWRMSNVLSEGDYIVDPSVLLADGITVADWWNEATILKVRKGRHLPYPVDPGFSVKIAKA
ncbi:ABC transporter ATP-binding protein [Candidatus Saccharibacteria bacterium]|nr:MAG: ABC transporter ATP-binding protein [Candidatus Saccharibacteria bacterium]